MNREKLINIIITGIIILKWAKEPTTTANKHKPITE